MKNYHRIFIGILLTVIAVQIVFLFQKNSSKNDATTPQTTITPDSLSPDEIIIQKNLWSEKMDNVGVAVAYTEFKELYRDKPFGTQHLMAHVVGQMIYEKEGIDGLAICDSTFSFGCYHSFFSQALLGEGLEIIKKLDKSCINTFGPLGSGCQHGIGHGVLEYFGPDKLLEALDTCQDTTWNNPLAGCVSGVFMEYNVPILITEADAASGVRPMEDNNPYAPCDDLPSKFQPSCYYEIAQWWEQGAFHHNFQKHGELCQNINNKEYREICFLGIGNVIGPVSNYDVAKTLERCQQMPNEQGKIMCQAGASWSFDANPDHRQLATSLCEGLLPKAKSACQHKAHLLNPENQ